MRNGEQEKMIINHNLVRRMSEGHVTRKTTMIIHPASNTPHHSYTPYEGLNLANQNNWKLEVFSRKLEEPSQNCIDILINFSEIK